MHTPYFPAFRSRLAALGRRTAHLLRQATLAQLEEHLRDFLPAPLLSAEDQGPNSRDRIFSLRLTFECFLWQLLKPKTSCREVVRQVQALFRLQGRGHVDEGDSAYIQARLRLPKERLEKALAATAQAADRRAGSGGQLHGRPVKVVDASTTQLADTRKNQRRYPQPSAQKPGCGFPVLRFVALFSLTSGAILNVILGSLHHHDLRLLRALWDQLKKGDILLGDRAYGEYTTLATGPRQGVDVVARLHARRKVDFRKARRLGKNDGLFVWTKGYQQSPILSATEWALLPAQITVRIIRFTAAIRGFRSRRITLVTTLLDPKLFPAQDLTGLYARRWRLELCLRDLKTTMGMEQLRGKTPDMAEKELLGYPGRPQPDPLRDGRSRRALRRGSGTGQFQGQRRCPAPIQRRDRQSAQPQNAPPTLGGSLTQPGPRLGPLPAQPSGTPCRQTATQTLPIAQPTTPLL